MDSDFRRNDGFWTFYESIKLRFPEPIGSRFDQGFLVKVPRGHSPWSPQLKRRKEANRGSRQRRMQDRPLNQEACLSRQIIVGVFRKKGLFPWVRQAATCTA